MGVFLEHNEIHFVQSSIIQTNELLLKSVIQYFRHLQAYIQPTEAKRVGFC